MNADEIVKTLRNCGKGKVACSECPYYIENNVHDCRFTAMYDAANEINHLKAEIYGQTDLIKSLQAENDSLAANGGKYMEIAEKRYEMYEAAIKRAEKAETQLTESQRKKKAAEGCTYFESKDR